MTQTFENGTVASGNGEAQTNRIQQIQVIFLRHGEREDETADYDKHRKTRQERVDPALTVLGHQQALGAWRKILAYVPEDKPIMVACSPLRRCIGTAMMVAAAAASNTSAETGPKFVLPMEIANSQEKIEKDAMDTTDENTETPSVPMIPMLVMNGLGDCAAQMRHMGGIGKAVKAGWLACAASPGNDCLHPDTTTPLQNSLQTIAANATNLQTRWGRNTVQETCKLQFWRESKYHYYESTPSSDFARMTEPKTLQEHATSRNVASSDSNPHPMPKNVPSCDERFDQAVERAVLLTAHAGLDTCILVTHREAIRWIETHWVRPALEPPPRTEDELEQQIKKKKHRRDPKVQATRTYCCVGDYQVSVDLTNAEKPRVMSWESKKVVPWEQLARDQQE